MKSIVSLVVPKIIEGIIGLIPQHKLNRVADKLLDWCEDAVARSENEYDNAVVLPLVKIIREAFNIEDNDEVN